MPSLRGDWAALFNRKKCVNTTTKSVIKPSQDVPPPLLQKDAVVAVREPSVSMANATPAADTFAFVFGTEPKTDAAAVIAASLDFENVIRSPQQVVVGVAQQGRVARSFPASPSELVDVPNAFESLGDVEPEDGEGADGEGADGEAPRSWQSMMAPIEEGEDGEEREVELQGKNVEHEKSGKAKRAKRVENTWTTLLSGVTKAELEQRLASEARLAFNGNPANGLFWKYRESVRQQRMSKQEGVAVTSVVGLCAFKNVPGCKCKAAIKYIQHGPAGHPATTYDLLMGSIPHSNHAVSSESANKMPLAVKSILSPGKLFQSQREFQKLAVAQGATLGQERLQHARNWHKDRRMQFKESVSGLTFAAQHTLGGLRTVIDALLPQNIADFDEHTVHVIGECIVKSASGSDPDGSEPDGSSSSTGPHVAVALSTEALLLNGYRMTRQAQPMQLVVDTTWKLVEEGHGCIVVGAVATDQVFHAIAYAFVDQECSVAHTFIFRQIKLGIENVVAKYASNNWLI
jgi:hypothetical protein